MTESVPPESRRSILVVGRDDYRSARENPDLIDLFDDEQSRIVRMPHPGDYSDPVVNLLREHGLLVPGTIAVQSPYHLDRYYASESALVEIVAQKVLKVTEIAQALGAREVTVADIRAERSDARTSVEARGKAEFVDAATSIEQELQNKLQRKIEARHSFVGGPPDIARANQILREAGLSGDTELRGLIDLRSAENTLTKFSLTFSGAHEAAANLRCAARIGQGVGRFKLAEVSTVVERQVETGIDVDVVTTVEFG